MKWIPRIRMFQGSGNEYAKLCESVNAEVNTFVEECCRKDNMTAGILQPTFILVDLDGLNNYHYCVPVVVSAKYDDNSVSVPKETLMQWRTQWLEENDPKDDTDCVTPFDQFLY